MNDTMTQLYHGPPLAARKTIDKLCELAPERADEFRTRWRTTGFPREEAHELIRKLEEARAEDARVAVAEQTNRQSDQQTLELQRQSLEQHRKIIRDERELASKQALTDSFWYRKEGFARQARRDIYATSCHISPLDSDSDLHPEWGSQ